jgi:cyclic pyranopterin phosphate synthase
MNSHNPLVDAFQRPVNYLRVSVTDRCNLRCRYCMTSHTRWLPKGAILTLEEIERLVGIGVGLGITKVRLTGGEPLCRKGIVDLIARLSKLNGLQDLTLTTNGTLLAQKAAALKEAGLRRINISLDTMDAAGFFNITGLNLLDTVWQGIVQAAAVGFNPIKINCVVMRGSNEDQIVPLAELTRSQPFHVRFIEYMPIAIDPHAAKSRFVPMAEVQQRLEKLGALIPLPSRNGDGPARRFRFQDAPGELGFISSMSEHFCSRCNRIRLTADGHLRPCLLADEQVDVMGALRAGADDEAIAAIFAKALAMKQGEHRLSFGGNCQLRTKMTDIGG